jgi:hypothetical protein
VHATGSSDPDDAPVRLRPEHPGMSSNGQTNPDAESDGLGARFWVTFAAGTVALGIAAVVIFVIFGAVWYAWGFLAAVIAFIVIASGLMYLSDRRARSRWS